MNFRSSLGHDLASTLESSSYHEMPVDRLGAFSRAPRLGTVLWRLKYAYDPTVYWRAVDLLSRESSVGLRLCELVIREWLDQNCPNCNGAMELIAGDRRIVCPSCDGSGVKRHSDHARAAFMGLSLTQWRTHAPRYKRALERLTRAERLVSATMHAELER